MHICLCKRAYVDKWKNAHLLVQVCVCGWVLNCTPGCASVRIDGKYDEQETVNRDRGNPQALNGEPEHKR